MGMFDFLNTATGAGTPNFINPDTGVLARDPGAKPDLGSLLQDPNFLQLLGNAGQKIASGGSIGEALNPSDMIRNIAGQQAGSQVSGQTNDLMQLLMKSLNDKPDAPTTITPANQEGPLEITHKAGQPSVIKMSTPETIAEARKNDANDAFGTNIPAESQRGGNVSPFAQALKNR